jgi:hypothetical protein
MISIFLYFDPEQKDSALRRAKKLLKDGYKLTEQTNECITLEKQIKWMQKV